MAVSAEKLFEKLKKDTLREVYFIIGEEGYLRNAAINEILKRAVDPAFKDFNLSIFQGGDAGADQIIGQAAAYPMLSERRTVVVRNVNQLDKNSQEAIAKYVRNPSGTTVMILEAPSIPAKSPLYKVVKKHKAVYEFQSLYENKIPFWVRSYVRRQDKSIDEGAVYCLIEFTGTNLQELANELDKLVLFVGKTEVIRREDVGNVVGISKKYNIFELQKSLGEGNLSKALHILHHMLQEGESPVGIIVMLTRYLSILWKINTGKREPMPRAELAKEVGVHVYFLNEYLAAAKRYGVRQLELALEQFMIADLQLKSGAVNAPLTLTIPLIALFRPQLFRQGWSPFITQA